MKSRSDGKSTTYFYNYPYYTTVTVCMIATGSKQENVPSGDGETVRDSDDDSERYVTLPALKIPET